MAPVETETRRALGELVETLREVDERYLGPEYNIQMPGDVVEGHRLLMHLLESGLYSHFEADPERPRFRRIVSPTRKLMGDNPDAIYFEAPVRPDRAYRIAGKTAGACYLSFTVEKDAGEGRFGSRTAGAINDTELDVAEDGSFELVLGGEPRPRRWLALPEGAGELTARFYFETERSVAADPTLHIPLAIEPLEPAPPPEPPTDASVAAGIRRVVNSVRGRTLGMPAPGQREMPPFVSVVPNQLPPPVTPGDHALAAPDAAYSMAPYFVGPDQALVVTGRWPECRFANLVLWNRFLQTYDYVHRRVSRNRVQTRLEPDGSFVMVLAARDPGHPNWIDTEGRPFGMMFFRFMLPEGEIATPEAKLVDWDEAPRL